MYFSKHNSRTLVTILIVLFAGISIVGCPTSSGTDPKEGEGEARVEGEVEGEVEGALPSIMNLRSKELLK